MLGSCGRRIAKVPTELELELVDLRLRTVRLNVEIDVAAETGVEVDIVAEAEIEVEIADNIRTTD